MKDIATIPDAASADDARLQILEATARLIQSGNTAIMPDGRIVPRGTPGAMAYESANHRNLGPVNITPECRHLQATNPDPTSTFVEHQGETIEVTKALVDALGRHGCPDCHGEGIERPPIRVIMFRPEFEAPITAGTKHHTIRGMAKRPWKFPMLLSLRVWTGAPYRTPQREFMQAPLLSVEGIRIHTDGVELRPGTVGAFWMGEEGKRRPMLENFARADGFATWVAMKELFIRMHGIDRKPLEGQLIRWREIDY